MCQSSARRVESSLAQVSFPAHNINTANFNAEQKKTSRNTEKQEEIMREKVEIAEELKEIKGDET